MTIFLSRNLVLTPSTELGPNNPVIGIHNLVTRDNIAADQELENYPAVNLANPDTSLLWRAEDDSPQRIVVSGLEGQTDYIGAARHNFGSAQIPVTYEGWDADEEEWVTLAGPALPGDDGPLLERAVPHNFDTVAISLGSGNAPAELAVLYTGKLLVLQRRIYVGHTPLPYGRRTVVEAGRSKKGDYHGSLVISESVATAVSLSNITPDWYRAHMDPFVAAANLRTPFFFAWRPLDYPREVGFAWFTEDASPTNSRNNGMMAITLPLEGIAR